MNATIYTAKAIQDESLVMVLIDRHTTAAVRVTRNRYTGDVSVCGGPCGYPGLDRQLQQAVEVIRSLSF